MAAQREYVPSQPGQPYAGATGSTPIPDPTVLTTQASERAIAALKELLEARLVAVEKSMGRIGEQMDSRPAAVIQEIAHLRTLTDEKFKGVDQQFAGRDTALAAALLAQKTSVEEQNKGNALSAAKSEASFTKQIDQIGDLIAAQAQGNDDKIDGIKTLIGAQAKTYDEKSNDLRDRLTNIDGRGAGSAMVIGYIALGISVLVGLIAIFTFINKTPVQVVREVPTVEAPK